MGTLPATPPNPITPQDTLGGSVPPARAHPYAGQRSRDPPSSPNHGCYQLPRVLGPSSSCVPPELSTAAPCPASPPLSLCLQRGHRAAISLRGGDRGATGKGEPGQETRLGGLWGGGVERSRATVGQAQSRGTAEGSGPGIWGWKSGVEVGVPSPARLGSHPQPHPEGLEDRGVPFLCCQRPDAALTVGSGPRKGPPSPKSWLSVRVGHPAAPIPAAPGPWDSPTSWQPLLVMGGWGGGQRSLLGHSTRYPSCRRGHAASLWGRRRSAVPTPALLTAGTSSVPTGGLEGGHKPGQPHRCGGDEESHAPTRVPRNPTCLLTRSFSEPGLVPDPRPRSPSPSWPPGAPPGPGALTATAAIAPSPPSQPVPPTQRPSSSPIG